MPESPIFSLTSTRGRCSPAITQLLSDDPVDARGQRADVLALDRREHPDAQLVAPELAVRLDVDDAVGAQRRGDRGGVHALVEVDRADDASSASPGP